MDDEYGLEILEITMTISLPDEITQAMTRGVAKGVEEAGYLDNVGPMDRLAQSRAADDAGRRQQPGRLGHGRHDDGHGHGDGFADGPKPWAPGWVAHPPPAAPLRPRCPAR